MKKSLAVAVPATLALLCALGFALAADATVPARSGAAAAGTAASGAAAAPDPAFAVLDGLAEESLPLSLKFPNTTLTELFGSIAQASGIKVALKSKVPGSARAAAKVKDKFAFHADTSPLKDILVRIAQERGLEYEVPEARRLVVTVLE